MKRLSTLLSCALFFALQGFAQPDFDMDQTRSDLAREACRCIDSISVWNKSRNEVTAEISDCIHDKALAYQLIAKLFSVDTSMLAPGGEGQNKRVEIAINSDRDSDKYKQYYWEIERDLMEGCKSLKAKLAGSEKQSKHSMSENPKAVKHYMAALDEAELENYSKAIKLYKKAIKIDPKFAFAWDNLGLCYRKTGDYDAAIEAYNESLEIDPYGLMPLQNLAIAYSYKQEYGKAIEIFEKLREVDEDNPEVYYGMGQIYAHYLNEYEKALENMCKAYNLYVDLDSPYRTHAEDIINQLYQAMKEQGQEQRFYEILGKYGIEAKE